MKRGIFTPIISFLVGLLALPSVSFSGAKQKELQTFDPIFGIAYYPSKVKFDPAPEEVFECRDLKEPRRKLWLFGETVNRGKTFLYLYGLVEVDFGAGPTGDFEAQNDDGIIVILAPSGCRNIGAGSILTTEDKYRRKAAELGLTEEVVSELLSDLVLREVKAFGGASKFLAKVKATGVRDADLHPQVRAKLQELRKSVQKPKGNE